MGRLFKLKDIFDLSNVDTIFYITRTPGALWIARSRGLGPLDLFFDVMPRKMWCIGLWTI